jgi:RNA polymerase sigma factor (sigma-70 family)
MSHCQEKTDIAGWLSEIPLLPKVAKEFGLEKDELLSELVLAFSRRDKVLRHHQQDSAFVYKAVRNIAIDLRRSKRYRSFGSILGDRETPASSHSDALTVVLECELISECQQAIAALPLKFQRLMRMRFFEGKSTAECADQLNVTRSCVTKQLRHACAELRRSSALAAWAD